jgi:hypothetical protein
MSNKYTILYLSLFALPGMMYRGRDSGCILYVMVVFIGE